jgi:AraC-like DNA-binding protein
LIWAAGFATSRAGVSLRAAGLLFCFGAVGFALNEDPVARGSIGLVTYPLWLLSVAAAGYFWLLVVALFEDRKLDGRDFLVPLLLTATGLAAHLSPARAQALLWVGHHLLEVAIAGHAMVVVVRSWRDDLVAARRRLRGPTMAAVTAFVLAWAGLELRRLSDHNSPDLGILVAAALALVAVASTAAFLEMRTILFGAAGRSRTPAVLAAVAEADANADLGRRIQRLMEVDEIWRREGLTVAAMAEAAAVPEYRLRAHINDELGFRNFSAFVNQKRIEAAKLALSDPERARQTIAAIAFELGFGSLGPFNRAFREAMGMTPTEFRARAGVKTPIKN